MDREIDPEALKLYKWGTIAFGAHALLNGLGLVVLLALELRYMAESSTNLLELPYASWMYSSLLIFVIPPIILAPITYYELYKPVKNNTFTSKTMKWNITLSILGFPYALIMGGLFLCSAYKKMGKR